MPKAGAGNRGSAARPPRQAGQVRPRLNALDFAVHLWRGKWLMLAVFLPVSVMGLTVAFTLPARYTATARVLVAPDGGARVDSEIELLRSPAAAKAALAKVALARAYPAIAHGCLLETCGQLGIKAVSDHLTVSGTPDNPVITARFAHARADMSAELLNALVAGYFDYRTDVLAGARPETLQAQRERFEEELAGAEDAIRTYLYTNNLTDLAAERDTVRALYTSASNELLLAQSRLRQAEAQLADYRRQIETVPAELEYQVRGAAEQTLRALKTQREEALEQFGAGSLVTLDLDQRVAEAEAVLAGDEGAVQRGPNPLYQHIAAATATLESEVKALRSQQAELKSQITGFEMRQRRLLELQPDLQELERRRDAAEMSVRSLTEREVEARTRIELMARGAGAVRVLEAATPPIASESLRFPAALLALLVAAAAAFAAGLVRALSKRGLATPGSAERTLDVPVLAAIPHYRT